MLRFLIENNLQIADSVAYFANIAGSESWFRVAIQHEPMRWTGTHHGVLLFKRMRSFRQRKPLTSCLAPCRDESEKMKKILILDAGGQVAYWVIHALAGREDIALTLLLRNPGKRQRAGR
ncbi:hypothetical protein [Janthinobacterium sp. KBS0711]|uniref:hypothetical protein n=1 Tax=Janthinobacterium sp. KBS0711 TaxID=1649647 RepID=UPI001F3A7D79|nr:hypothetical protein [Janthinobacterium sp. KBS0711]